MPLTKARLRTHAHDEVAYCPTCRCDVNVTLERDEDDEDEPLRCLTCGDLLELARKTVTPVDVSGIDMPAILADLRIEYDLSIDQLPDDAMHLDSLSCSTFEVVGGDEARPL